MAGVVAIGSAHSLEGFALAGASVVLSDRASVISRAWDELAPDTGLVILSTDAAEILGERVGERPDVLVAVQP